MAVLSDKYKLLSQSIISSRLINCCSSMFLQKSTYSIKDRSLTRIPRRSFIWKCKWKWKLIILQRLLQMCSDTEFVNQCNTMRPPLCSWKHSGTVCRGAFSQLKYEIPIREYVSWTWFSGMFYATKSFTHKGYCLMVPSIMLSQPSHYSHRLFIFPSGHPTAIIYSRNSTQLPLNQPY